MTRTEEFVSEEELAIARDIITRYNKPTALENKITDLLEKAYELTNKLGNEYKFAYNTTDRKQEEANGNTRQVKSLWHKFLNPHDYYGTLQYMLGHFYNAFASVYQGYEYKTEKQPATYKLWVELYDVYLELRESLEEEMVYYQNKPKL